MLTCDKSTINIYGAVRLWARRPDLSIFLEHSGPNIITTAGKARVATIFATNDTSFRIPEYMRIGTGSAVPTEADTGLAGVILASSLAALTYNENEVSLTATFTNAGGTDWEVNEAGIFTDAPENLLFARFLTPKFIVDPGGYCTILWKIGFGSTPNL